MIEHLIYWLPLIGTWLGIASVALKKAKRKMPKQPAWVVRVDGVEDSSQEAYRTLYPNLSRDKPVHAQFMAIRLHRRGSKPSEYVTIGKVAIGDDSFDMKLAELRGIAEEQAATLNSQF